MQLRSKECPYSFSAIELINDLMPQFPYTQTCTKEFIEVKQLNLIKALFLVSVTVSNIFYQSL